MEYVVGPVIALLLGMKFTAFTTKKQEERIAAAEAKIEQIENEMPKRLMATVAPVTVAIKKLNQQVGIWWM